MSITVPHLRTAHLRMPLLLAFLMLAVAGFCLSAAPLPISLLSADYLGAASSSGTNGRADDRLLFDTETEPVVEGEILDRWHRVKADIAGEFDALRQCLAAAAGRASG